MQIKVRDQIKKEKFLIKQCMSKNPKMGNAIPVRCITTNEFFQSMKEAANYYGLLCNSISDVCRGKQKTTKGLSFEYSLGFGRKYGK